MAYVGKYFDRNPSIRPAGVVILPNCNTGDTMKLYSEEEWAENTIRRKCYEHVKAQIMRPVQRAPYSDEDRITDLLEIETKKSRFVAFREKFAENMYFKKPELGKVFPLDSKPEEINNFNTTFGKKTPRSESVYDVVFPNKTPDQVNKEYIFFHDKYLLSHRHYLPSEQIRRGYKRPPYDPNSTFGSQNNVDFTGTKVKRCLTELERQIVVSNAQKGFLERSMGLLGKKVVRFPISDELEFGQRKYTDPYTVKNLMENIEPAVLRTNIVDAITHIAHVRRKLFNRVGYHMTDLKYALEAGDPKNTGYLSVSRVYEILRNELIRVNCEKFRDALHYYGMVEDECTPNERVKIETVWKLLHKQYGLPHKVTKFPDDEYNNSKDSTYFAMCNDLKKPLPPERPQIVRKHLDCADDEPTTMGDLITPEVPVQLGLLPSDFDFPRNKEELQRIFQRVIDDPFDELWQKAKQKYKVENDLISVNQLRKVMMELRRKRTIMQQEQIKNIV